MQSVTATIRRKSAKERVTGLLLLVVEYLGDLCIELRRAPGIEGAQRPCHHELREGEQPGPGDRADRRRIENLRIGGQQRKGEVERQEEERYRNDKASLVRQQRPEGGGVSDLRPIRW